jgi:hypothetical protein
LPRPFPSQDRSHCLTLFAADRYHESASRWNADRQAVEFGIDIGEYEGVVRIPRQVFRRFVDGAVTPERCLEAYYLQRTRFELAAEKKLRRRQLTDDGNIEITGRDLHEPKSQRPGRPSWPVYHPGPQ